MLKDGYGDKCLVVGSDSMSKIIDWNDRSTSVLFGDGAGAVILEKIGKPKLLKMINGVF